MLLGCGGLTLNAVAEEAIVQKFEFSEPRTFAYQIGDSLKRTVELKLRKPYELKTELLPSRKRMGRWIALTSAEYEMTETESAREYKIEFNYQIINIIPELREIILPRHFLSYGKDKNLVKLVVPTSKKIGVSSVINSSDGSKEIQLSRAPLLLAQSTKDLLLYGILFLVSLIGLLLSLWGLPFSNEKMPFKAALTTYKKSYSKKWGLEQYSIALKIIHKAFNETSDKTVFAETLTDFFNDHKQFNSIKDEIEEFFEYSKKHFFMTDELSETPEKSYAELASFIKKCRQIELGK